MKREKKIEKLSFPILIVEFKNTFEKFQNFRMNAFVSRQNHSLFNFNNSLVKKRKSKMRKIVSLALIIGSISIIAQSKNTPREVTAIYKDATVYTGYTNYLFKDVKTGKDIEIQATDKNIDPDLAKKIEVPKDLLEDPRNIEGLPGANPKLIGKKFKIKYLKDDKILIIRAK